MKDFAEVEEKIIVGLLITATVLVVQGYGNRCEKKDEIELYDKQNPTYYKCWPFPECLDGQEPTVEPGSTHPMGTDISCQSCQQNFYSNKGTNIRCRKCTSCGKKLELSPCLSVKDRECADRCISNDYYFNSTDKECHRCTECCEGDNMNIESQCIKLTPGTVIGGKGQKHCRRSPKPCNDLPKENLTSSGCDCNSTMLSDSSLLKGSDTQMNCSSPNKTSLIEKEQTNQNLSSSSKQCSGHSFDRLHIILLCLLGLIISVILFWGWLAWKRRKQSLHSENSFPLESLGCSCVRNVTCLPTCSSLAEREPLRTGSNSHQEELNVIPEGNSISRNEGSSHASDAQREDDLNVENIPADILVSSMENLRDENGTLFHYVQMKLDAFETNTRKTWFSVGRELNVESDMLNLMQAERRSHTQCLLEYLQTLTEVPTMREFVQALKNCGRNDIAKYICNWPWLQQNIE